MGLLSLTPTFTQGFILVQMSILVLLAYVLRYLSSDTNRPQLVEEETEQDVPTASPPRFSIKTPPLSPPSKDKSHFTVLDYAQRLQDSSESLEWFNFLLANVRPRSTCEKKMVNQCSPCR